MNNRNKASDIGKYKVFKDFWPFYLSQHSNKINRRLHFIGTTLSILFFVISILNQNIYFLVAAIFIGYAFAWIGHFFIEKNKPATFTYFWWSLVGDFKMYILILTGKINI